MLAQGAHVAGHLGAARVRRSSGANYEVPEQMAADVEARLPGSRTTTARGTPGLDLRAGIARQLIGRGRQGHRRRPALHRRRPEAVQPPPRRADRPAGLTGVDGMNATSPREAELAAALTARARAAGRGGRRPPAATSTTSSCCRSPSSSRPPTSRSCGGWAAAASASPASRRPRPRSPSSGADRSPPARPLAHGRPDPAQQGQTHCGVGRYGALAEHRQGGRRAGSRRRGRRSTTACAPTPSTCFVQISLDGDTERGGVDVGDPAAVDAICAQVRRGRTGCDSSD